MITKAFNNKMYLRSALALFFVTTTTSFGGAIQDLSSADQLQSLLENGKPSVVVFHSPSCPHCRRFLPKFQRVALRFPNVNCAEVNVASHFDLAKANGVTGVPRTIFYDATGKKIDSVGGDISEKVLETTIQQKTGVAPQ